MPAGGASELVGLGVVAPGAHAVPGEVVGLEGVHGAPIYGVR
jgi:hypothetical protein